MPSLKNYNQKLSRLIGITPAVLYERQRVLADAGLLQVNSGRGPGSGVPFEAATVALSLIAIAVADRISEVDARTRLVAQLEPDIYDHFSAYKDQRDFHKALAGLLRDPRRSDQVTTVKICYAARWAEIHYRDEDGEGKTKFAAPVDIVPPFRTIAVIDGDLIKMISQDIAEAD